MCEAPADPVQPVQQHTPNGFDPAHSAMHAAIAALERALEHERTRADRAEARADRLMELLCKRRSWRRWFR